MSAADSVSLSARTIKAGIWTVGARLISRMIDFAVLLILAWAAPASALTSDTPPAETPAAGSDAEPEVPSAGEPLPTILRSESDLPEPVRAMRQKLIDAARTGDIEALRGLMKEQPEQPAVALGDPGDPIEYLKQLAADAEGREILAILVEVLNAGFVHVGAGTPDEAFVWPYFANYPIDALTTTTTALREWVGLAAYWLTGRLDSSFPSTVP